MLDVHLTYLVTYLIQVKHFFISDDIKILMCKLVHVIPYTVLSHFHFFAVLERLWNWVQFCIFNNSYCAVYLSCFLSDTDTLLSAFLHVMRSCNYSFFSWLEWCAYCFHCVRLSVRKNNITVMHCSCYFFLVETKTLLFIHFVIRDYVLGG